MNKLYSIISKRNILNTARTSKIAFSLLAGLLFSQGGFAQDTDTCTATETFDFSFDDFTAFPQQCWSASHGSPMFSLAGTTDKSVQVYSFMSGASDFYLVTPQVSTIDGEHVLEFNVGTVSAGLKIQIGTLLSPTNYGSFVSAGNLITPEAGTLYTSIAIPAVEDHNYVAFKIIPNGDHKAVTINNAKWKSANLSVGGFEKNLVKVYPNPTTDYVTIQSEKRVAQVNLYNQLGQLVSNQGSDVLDLTKVSTGVYFAEILFENNVSVTKRVIKK